MPEPDDSADVVEDPGIRSKRHRGRGGLMRGVSRPMSHARRNTSLGSMQPRNSVDRISGLDDDNDDGDTIYLSGAPAAGGTQDNGANNAAKSANGAGRANAARRSLVSDAVTGTPTAEDQELDEALEANDAEIEALKARLAKHQRRARQAREIEELKKQLGKYESI